MCLLFQKTQFQTPIDYRKVKTFSAILENVKQNITIINTLFLFIFSPMRMFGHLKAVPMALLGLSFVFFACSSESTSSSSDDSPETEYSSTKGESSSSESDKDSNDKSSSSVAKDEPTVSEKSSSSVKQETVSGQEALNEPQNKINGSCGPSSDKINKGDIATWQFFRDEGEVWDQILAPFVWTFEGTASKSIQGNGLNQVNIRYENSGTYTASLLVDGNSVLCDTLQVQGVPIVIESCEPIPASAVAGDIVSWKVVSNSDSPIKSYSWSSDFGTVNANGAEASLTTDASMHKKNVFVTVNVTNEDKTTETYACKPVTVIDPNMVDVTIAHSGISDSTKQVFPGGQTIVAQYPSNAVNCQMVCGAQGNGVILEVDGVAHTIDYSLNITPESCKDGSAAGSKITITASMNVYCYVTY